MLSQGPSRQKMSQLKGDVRKPCLRRTSGRNPHFAGTQRNLYEFRSFIAELRRPDGKRDIEKIEKNSAVTTQTETSTQQKKNKKI